MADKYDIFFSHAWADGDRPRQIADALAKAGLRVWFDGKDVNDFASITRAVMQGLAQSKALLAYYSGTYPLRRACQWELTTAFLAGQAEGDPRCRVLVINPEEKAGHIHPELLRDAKFCRVPENDSGAMEDLIQSIVRHVDGLDGPLADIHPLIPPNWHPQRRVGSTRFVGRLAEMWQVHSLLHAGDATQITGATVINGGIGSVSGLAGVGKSLLAEEYALRFGAAYPGGVFWLRAYGNDYSNTVSGAEQREALRTDQMRQIAERLNIETQGRTQYQIESAVAQKIGDEGKSCLWVVDDVPHGWDSDTLRRWFGPHSLARTLLTTQSRGYGSIARGIDLSSLPPSEAMLLLTSRRRPVGWYEEEQASGLAQDLGHHALALDITASALQSWAAVGPYADFRDKLARHDKDVLLLAETLADALPNGHQKSISQTLLSSIRGLCEEGLDFLRLASVLAVEPIPASLLISILQRTDGLNREDAEERTSLAFQQVTSASLAEIAGEHQDARSVHALVSRVIHFFDRDVPSRTEAIRAAAVAVLAEELARAAENPELHKQIEFTIGHARHMVKIPVTENDCSLISWVSMYDYVRGRYASARIFEERQFEFRLRTRGPEDPATLASTCNLAQIAWAQGNRSEARQLQERALDVSRRVLGDEHRDTLKLMNNLASALGSLGDYSGARRLQEQVLEVKLRVQGDQHTDTLCAMNNLASTLQSQGHHSDALELQERAVKVSRSVLGDEHLETLTHMSTLASILHSMGKLREAWQVQHYVAMGRTRLLGDEHPNTLTSVSNLALMLTSLGEHSGALRINEGVLTIRTRVLGDEHPDTLTSMSNLASALASLRDYIRAQKLQERELEVTRRVLGDEHPNTLTAMNNLALTLKAQANIAEARQLQERVLDVSRRVLGDEHLDTLRAMNNLGVTLKSQGNIKEARQFQERVLEVTERRFGEEHPATLAAMDNLVMTLMDIGEKVNALRMYRRYVAAHRVVYGDQHPDTILLTEFVQRLEQESLDI